jgi:hypothetical protein
MWMYANNEHSRRPTFRRRSRLMAALRPEYKYLKLILCAHKSNVTRRRLQLLFLFKAQKVSCALLADDANFACALWLRCSRRVINHVIFIRMQGRRVTRGILKFVLAQHFSVKISFRWMRINFLVDCVTRAEKYLCIYSVLAEWRGGCFWSSEKFWVMMTRRNCTIFSDQRATGWRQLGKRE